MKWAAPIRSERRSLRHQVVLLGWKELRKIANFFFFKVFFCVPKVIIIFMDIVYYKRL